MTNTYLDTSNLCELSKRVSPIRKSHKNYQEKIDKIVKRLREDDTVYSLEESCMIACDLKLEYDAVSIIEIDECCEYPDCSVRAEINDRILWVNRQFGISPPLTIEEEYIRFLLHEHRNFTRWQKIELDNFTDYLFMCRYDELFRHHTNRIINELSSPKVKDEEEPVRWYTPQIRREMAKGKDPEWLSRVEEQMHQSFLAEEEKDKKKREKEKQFAYTDIDKQDQIGSLMTEMFKTQSRLDRDIPIERKKSLVGRIKCWLSSMKK